MRVQRSDVRFANGRKVDWYFGWMAVGEQVRSEQGPRPNLRVPPCVWRAGGPGPWSKDQRNLQ